MADGDEITDVERLVEFWHSSGGDIARNKDLAGIAVEVLKELKAVLIVRDIVADPVDIEALMRAGEYLDELDRA
jgi:hypothetical protein